MSKQRLRNHQSVSDYGVAVFRWLNICITAPRPQSAGESPAPVSVIATRTVSTVCDEAGVAVDSRRFRANIVLDCNEAVPFAEDDWVGRVIMFGVGASAPAIHVTKRDVRCKMISLDPDTAQHDPSVLKTAVSLNENNAGVYGVVICTGTMNIGDPVFVLDNNAV